MFAFVMLLGCGPVAEEPWGKAQGNLATRLTLVTEKPTLGQPLRFKLEIKNVGDAPTKYDAQQAKVNNPLRILGPDGEAVAYVGMSYQTHGSSNTLQPASVDTIFDDVDATEQYLFTKPGKHTITFKSQRYGPLPESNQLIVVLADGKLSDKSLLLHALIKDVPAGWHAGRRGEEIYLVNSPTNLKADFAIITLSFSQDMKPPQPNLDSLGKTRLGHAWLEASEKAKQRWPEYKNFVEERLKEFRVRE